MATCADCGKVVPEADVVDREMCSAHLRHDCANLGLCCACAELLEGEIDLEDMESEEEDTDACSA